jgi:hypothetical protein
MTSVGRLSRVGRSGEEEDDGTTIRRRGTAETRWLNTGEEGDDGATIRRRGTDETRWLSTETPSVSLCSLGVELVTALVTDLVTLRPLPRSTLGSKDGLGLTSLVRRRPRRRGGGVSLIYQVKERHKDNRQKLNCTVLSKSLKRSEGYGERGPPGGLAFHFLVVMFYIL